MPESRTALASSEEGRTITSTTTSRAPNGRPERRSFNRRQTSLTGLVSTSPDFQKNWPVSVQDISLIGMHIVGDLSEFDATRIYFCLTGTKTCIACDRVSQNDDGIRVKIELAQLELQKLVLESDVYASLVLEAVPDELPSI